MPTRPPLPQGTIGVLVVEDDTILRMDTSDAFANAGMNVFEARNADEAMAVLVQRADISVVITDLDMPLGQMSGHQLVEAIAARWPNIGVVILSGAGAARPRVLAEDVRFLHKPSSPNELVSAAFAIMSRLTGGI